MNQLPERPTAEWFNLRVANSPGLFFSSVLGTQNLKSRVCFKKLKKIEKMFYNVVCSLEENCSYRCSDFYLLVPYLMSSIESYLSNKPKQCILKKFK